MAVRLAVADVGQALEVLAQVAGGVGGGRCGREAWMWRCALMPW